MTTAFDADTALDGRRRALARAGHASTGSSQRGPNGGLVAALATRALTRGRRRRGPRAALAARCTTSRRRWRASSRSSPRSSARAARRRSRALRVARRSGVTVAYGLGCCSAWREGQPEWDVLERPDVPRPGEIASLEPVDGAAAFLCQLRDAPARTAPHVGALDARRRAARGRPGAARRAHRRLGPGGASRTWTHPTFVADHRPHDPLARSARRAATGEHPWVLGAVLHAASGAGGTWEEDGGCGARTASCSPSHASSRSCANPR